MSQLHTTCERNQRQNVACSAHLMSNTTATALKRYFPKENIQLAGNVTDFIDVIKKLFDIMNSYPSSAKIITNVSYEK